MIELKGIGKRLGSQAVLQALDLAVAPGECVVLRGPSGAGKTTLLRIVAGLEVPDAGAVWLRGMEASRPGWILPPHERLLGFQFQESALWPHMTLLQNVAYTLNGDKQRAAECLERAGLAALRHRRPAEISGGEARRAALARALAPRRDIVLLDEPLSNLQPELRAAMARWVAEELNATGAACLWVTHDAEDVDCLAPRTVELSAGTIVQPGVCG